MTSIQASQPLSSTQEVSPPVDLRRAGAAVKDAYTRPLDAFDAAEAQNIPATSKLGHDSGSLGTSWLWRHGRRHLKQGHPVRGVGMWAGAVVVAPVAVMFNVLTLVTASGLGGVWAGNAQHPRTLLGTREDVICKSMDRLDALVVHYSRPEYIERVTKRQLDPSPLLRVLRDTRASLQQLAEQPDLHERLRKSHIINTRAASIRGKALKLETRLAPLVPTSRPTTARE